MYVLLKDIQDAEIWNHKLCQFAPFTLSLLNYIAQVSASSLTFTFVDNCIVIFAIGTVGIHGMVFIYLGEDGAI